MRQIVGGEDHQVLINQDLHLPCADGLRERLGLVRQRLNVDGVGLVGQSVVLEDELLKRLSLRFVRHRATTKRFDGGAVIEEVGQRFRVVALPLLEDQAVLPSRLDLAYLEKRNVKPVWDVLQARQRV
ncbi:hypothetical protein D3C72_749870 [compost metagenome]